MLPRRRSAWLWVLAFSGAACGPMPEGTSPSPPPDHARTERLERQLDEARGENAMLAARVKELVAREKELSAELEKVKFLKAQQDRQIKVLAGALGERDLYKARAELLAEKAEQLSRKIVELEIVIEKLKRATSAPATQPAK